MVAKSRRPLACGAVRVAFMVRKDIARIAVQSFNTPRGTVLVSTPEATAVDIVGYYHQAGGLDQAATVLGELAENLKPDKLLAAVQIAPVPWAQRLGYLLEKVDAAAVAAPLKSYVGEKARQTALLLPTAPAASAHRDDSWKLLINADVEAEL